MRSIKTIYNFCNKNKCCPLAYAMNAKNKGFAVWDYNPIPSLAANILNITFSAAANIAQNWDDGRRTQAIKLAREIGIV